MSKQVEQSPKTNAQERTLFVKANTFNSEGKEVGTRIVDMYHFGTRNWLQNHLWWAMHNGHTVETTVADEAEVQQHMNALKEALVNKFNGAKAA